MVVTSLTLNLTNGKYSISDIGNIFAQCNALLTNIVGSGEVLNRIKLIDGDTFITISDKTFTDNVSGSFTFFPDVNRKYNEIEVLGEGQSSDLSCSFLRLVRNTE